MSTAEAGAAEAKTARPKRKRRTAAPRWSPEKAASGHIYKGPGYCVRCGCADFVHQVQP